MNVTLPTKSLSAALKAAAKVVESTNTIPIMANVLFEVTPGSVTLTASDLTIWYRQSLVCDSSDTFSFTTDAKAIDRIVSSAARDTVKLSVTDNRVTITSGKGRSSLGTIDAKDYPMPREDDYAGTIEIDGDTLARAMDRAKHAISADDTRYYMNGEFMHVSGGKLYFVATDGHRLARIYAGEADGVPDIIIGTKAVRNISNMARDRSVKIDVAAGTIRVEAGDACIISKTVDGTFPDYMRIVPASLPSNATVDAAELNAAIGRAASVSTGKSTSMAFSFEDGRIGLSMADQSGATAEDEVASEYEGEPVRLGLNYQYVLDTLSQCEGRVRIGNAGPMAAMRIEEVGNTEDVFVIMPTRI